MTNKILLLVFCTNFYFFTYKSSASVSLRIREYTIERIESAQQARLSIEEDRTSYMEKGIDLTDGSPLGNAAILFLKSCQNKHANISKLNFKESNYDFFKRKSCFEDYCQGDWRTNAILKPLWVEYYLNGGNFFLESENFEEAKRCFKKAAQINPDQTEHDLNHNLALSMNFFSKIKNITSIALRDSSYFEQHAVFYEEILETIKPDTLNFQNYLLLALSNYHANEWEKFLTFSQSITKETWKTCNLDEIISEFGYFKRYQAESYYHLKQLEKALQTYEELKLEPIEWTGIEHKYLSLIYAKQEEWSKSFYHFKKILPCMKPLKNEDKYKLLSFEEDEIRLLIEMFSKRTFKEYQAEVKVLINFMGKEFPSLKKDINVLLAYLKNKKKEASRKVIAEAIAFERFNEFTEPYKIFDQQYQNLWICMSSLKTDTDLFALLDQYAQEIEKNYAHLLDLKVKGQISRDIQQINDSSQLLREYFSLFFKAIKKCQHQLTLFKHQQYKGQSQEDKKEYESFILDLTSPIVSPSLKSQILADHAQREKKELQKLNTHKVKQYSSSGKRGRGRGRGRQFSKAQEQQQQTSVLESETSLPSSMLHSFKNRTTQAVWENKELGDYPDHSLEMLNALNQARNMHHLHTLLTPGTALKILKGDRKGQVSLRINQQYRLCFYWIAGEGAFDIEIVDYH